MGAAPPSLKSRHCGGFTNEIITQWFKLATQTPAQSQMQPITGNLYMEGPRQHGSPTPKSRNVTLCFRLSLSHVHHTGQNNDDKKNSDKLGLKPEKIVF